ncbi:hypothetical protein MC885_012880, partial [Smutsia gigantea]
MTSPCTTLGGSLTEKPGACPPDDGPCLSAPDQCVDDGQCPSKMKCCYQACFRQCVHKVSVKQGSCPQDRLHCLSPVQHLCHKDADCSGSRRCCLGACGRDCRNPTRGSMAPSIGLGFPAGRHGDGKPRTCHPDSTTSACCSSNPPKNPHLRSLPLQPIQPWFLLLGPRSITKPQRTPIALSTATLSFLPFMTPTFISLCT